MEIVAAEVHVIGRPEKFQRRRFRIRAEVITTSLRTTLTFVTAMFPAASVAITSHSFVPALNGKPSTQNRPLRSTKANPLHD